MIFFKSQLCHLWTCLLSDDFLFVDLLMLKTKQKKKKEEYKPSFIEN